MANAQEKNRGGDKEREIWDERKDATNFSILAEEGLTNRVISEGYQRNEGREGRSSVGSGGQENSKCKFPEVGIRHVW